MDFFFGEVPSTSQSSPSDGQNGHEDSQMTEDMDHNSVIGMASSESVTEIQEQQTSSDIDEISRGIQNLVKKINDSRTSDQKVIDSFQEKLTEKMTAMFQEMKEHMYTIYEENSNDMQVKLQELLEVLESCTKLNKELMEASQALSGLTCGLTMSHASEP